MNLLHDEIEDIAEQIKLRIIARRHPLQVHIRASGEVAVSEPDRPPARCSDATLLGHYTRKAAVADIEDDLAWWRRRLVGDGTPGLSAKALKAL